MSIRQGSNIISGAKSKELGLLTPQWYDYVLDDINWIRADNFSWHKGTIYTATYQHLLSDIDGKTTQTETIEGTTITFYLADDGHKIVERSQEAAVQTIYENTGMSWYYIIDRNNSLFKLPRARAQAENMHLYFYAGNFAQSLDENNPTTPITGETNWGEIGGTLSDQTDLQDRLPLLRADRRGFPDPVLCVQRRGQGFRAGNELSGGLPAGYGGHSRGEPAGSHAQRPAEFLASR